ncbi:MAG: sodium-dependent transporter [Parasphingopyxis sp.]|uniref:sodium-dependent transporter n=1 Tax=Parasphingopyxis sp. TaxID=1920299 RepID=UPI003F9FDBED
MATNIKAPGIGASQASDTSGNQWSSRLTFILAAVGSAVGLGNVWKFPYIVGENGGGAFVLVYLLCIALIGVPVLTAEILAGRRGGASPIRSFGIMAERDGHSPNWQVIGWLGGLCAFLILSFYSVVAGWALAYLGYAVGGDLSAAGGADDVGAAMGTLFETLLASPAALVGGHTVVMAITILIVASGVRGGLEKAIRWMVPGIFAILAGLVIYAAMASGEFGRAAHFMFAPDFSALSWDAVLVALGHAFFTLSIGMTAMMAYGAHLQKDAPLGSSAVAIAGLDTLVALMAGLAIFPIVFAAGLEPAAGPGLVFVTLPIAFADIPGGMIVATLFFLFLAVAALSSTISVLEPVVEYIEERTPLTRKGAAVASGGAIWLLGIGCALSFNIAGDMRLWDRNLFDLLDFTTSAILLPLGGLLIALYVGYVLPERAVQAELAGIGPRGYAVLRGLLRYVAPLGIATVFVYGLV